MSLNNVVSHPIAQDHPVNQNAIGYVPRPPHIKQPENTRLPLDSWHSIWFGSFYATSYAQGDNGLFLLKDDQFRNSGKLINWRFLSGEKDLRHLKKEQIHYDHYFVEFSKIKNNLNVEIYPYQLGFMKYEADLEEHFASHKENKFYNIVKDFTAQTMELLSFEPDEVVFKKEFPNGYQKEIIILQEMIQDALSQPTKKSLVFHA